MNIDHFKVGLLYCREGQQSEEEMYNNEEVLLANFLFNLI